MTGREAAMVRGVPILRGDDQWKLRLELIDNRDNLVTEGHRQRAAGQEIVLYVLQNQRLHRFLSFRINFVLSSCKLNSSPAGYWCGLTIRLMPGCNIAICRRARSRDSVREDA